MGTAGQRWGWPDKDGDGQTKMGRPDEDGDGWTKMGMNPDKDRDVMRRFRVSGERELGMGVSVTE